ncbi:MAG: hypothetical protein NTV30_03185 [Chloroflexi bacterium]|nr:hypothetical protein [Chloroflexota bacterium]
MDKKPQILVINKVDIVAPDVEKSHFNDLVIDINKFIPGNKDDSVIISARKGWGLDKLISRIAEMLSATMINPVKPYNYSEY